MKKQLEIVQLLRALGCVLIALYHLPSGYFLKPDHSGFVLSVFFTISGFFLIKGITKTTKNYFRKKIIRIVPLYWLLTLTIFVAEMIKPGLVSDNAVTPVMLVKSMFFIPYYSSGNNIFPVLSVGWTLIIEFFVYIIFYLCFIISKKLFYNKKRYEMFSVLLYGIIVLCGTILKNVLKIHNPFMEVWGSTYQWSFIMGMTIYFFASEGKCSKKSQHNSILVSYACVVGLLLVFILYSYFVSYFSVFAAGIVVCLCLLMLNELHVPKFFVLLGNVSFSFYLVHKFVIGVVLKLMPYTKLSGIVSELTAGCLVVMISFGVSYVLYILIEKRFTSFLQKKLCK